MERAKILNAIEQYHRLQGTVFLSPSAVEDYFRGLTELIETLIEENSSAPTEEKITPPKV